MKVSEQLLSSLSSAVVRGWRLPCGFVLLLYFLAAAGSRLPSPFPGAYEEGGSQSGSALDFERDAVVQRSLQRWWFLENMRFPDAFRLIHPDRLDPDGGITLEEGEAGLPYKRGLGIPWSVYADHEGQACFCLVYQFRVPRKIEDLSVGGGCILYPPSTSLGAEDWPGDYFLRVRERWVQSEGQWFLISALLETV